MPPYLMRPTSHLLSLTPLPNFPTHTCKPTTSQHTLSRGLSCKLDLVMGWISAAPAKDEGKKKNSLLNILQKKIPSERLTEAPKIALQVFII